jgi:hypothetical protein
MDDDTGAVGRTDDKDLRKEALERIKARRGFAPHLIAYLVVNAFLVGVWAMGDPRGYFWPAWIIGGWGIGIVMHAWAAFFQRPISEDEIRKEMTRGRTA